jgi:predicted helicase
METLESFYESVRKRAEDIDNSESKQKIIIELYDKFFKTAFPKMVEKLGIVYTPVEVVDFIIHSVNDILKKEFNRSLTDENIHILDPFTGTGTFITRLLQSGLIKKKDLMRKYEREIHANEIVLLAYYIAAVNIENAFHDLSGSEDYKSFEGICLTDTFQLGETDESEVLFSEIFPQNSERVKSQKKAPLRVIIGNPPYSIGQKSANDNAQNQSYPKLDTKVAETYVKESSAGLNKSLYDPYIKAFRWSTDRLDKNGGIVAFVSNGGWLDGNSTDGFRKCLEKEFSSIYVFNLRGNCRTQGELRRKEAGNVFGLGSRTPISITLLVKKPEKSKEKAIIHYHDIGDYLNREEKLKIISKFKTIANPDMSLIELQPNEHGDWLSQRSDVFGTFVPIEPVKKFDTKTQSIFNAYSLGLGTNRDVWCYNNSAIKLRENISASIKFYNDQRLIFREKSKINGNLKVEDIIVYDSAKLNWTDSVIKDLFNDEVYSFKQKAIAIGLYRPYTKQRLYYAKELIHRTYQQMKLFPSSEHINLVVCVSGVGASKDFSVLLANCIPDLQLQFNGQCFPLYYYEKNDQAQMSVFDQSNDEYIRRDGVSDFILERAYKIYGKNVTKEDIFYYVYGFLHSPEYREKFASDLKKMLPRLPLVEDVRDFWKFSKAGRALADLHINYETVPPYEGVKVSGAEKGNFRVDKMKFPKKGQKDAIIYNDRITIDNIPERAYEYVVNGRSAIEWIMERYQVAIHKESGIKNDPNDWADEVGNPRYILDLLLSIINVSLQTLDIVESLPKVKFE